MKPTAVSAVSRRHGFASCISLLAATLGASLAAAGCSGSRETVVPPAVAPPPAPQPTPAPSAEDAFIETLLARMTVEEKLGQLTQRAGKWGDDLRCSIEADHREDIRKGRVGSFLSVFGAEFTRELQKVAVEESRLGIPLLFAFDVIHGFRTTYPVPLAEVSSWDPDAVERAARASAQEGAAAGIHWTFAPMVDIARDARWGRIVEGAGEDPYLGSVMAQARVRGIQGTDLGQPDTLLACAKHFVGYGGAEAGRDYNTVEVSPQTLAEIYLPPFKAALEADAATVMSAFNEIGGVPMTAHRQLIEDVMRRDWDFAGFVVSDWESVGELIPHGVAATRAEAARLGISAGVDMEMVSGTYLEHLAELISQGLVTIEQVDHSVRRVLRAKYRLGLFEDPYRYSDGTREQAQTLSAAQRTAAREMARRSIVLLKNEGSVLPLQKDLKRLAVIGPLSDDAESALGPWSAPAQATDAISVLQGIKAATTPGTRLLTATGCKLTGDLEQSRKEIAQAVAVASKADAVVLVLGEHATMSGEATSRASVELPGAQRQLAQAVLKTGKPVVVVLMNGRPLAIPWLAEHAAAILETWFLGVEMGPAVADVLFGDFNPGGKLPVSFPRATGQAPIYYNSKRTGRPGDKEVKWSSKYIDLPLGPLYPFGHGLSYTSFEYTDLQLSSKKVRAGETLSISLRLKNTGARAGAEVVQLYIRDPAASITRPVQELKGFHRVALEPGASSTVSFEVPVGLLGFFNQDLRYVLEPGAVGILVGSSAEDVRLRTELEIVSAAVEIETETMLFSRVSVD